MKFNVEEYRIVLSRILALIALLFLFDGRSYWETENKTLGERIGDFVVGGFDNDRSDELVIAMVSKEGEAAVADAVSHLISFDPISQ
jgi:hypothetical protein